MEAQTIDPATSAVGTGSLSCFNCTLNLTGHRYILRDEKPFCIKCYEQLFANRCEECKDIIGTDFKVREFCYLCPQVAGYNTKETVMAYILTGWLTHRVAAKQANESVSCFQVFVNYAELCSYFQYLLLSAAKPFLSRLLDDF